MVRVADHTRNTMNDQPNLQEQLKDLQHRFDVLNASHAEVCATLEAAQKRVTELEAMASTWEWHAKGIKSGYAETRRIIEAALRDFQP